MAAARNGRSSGRPFPHPNTNKREMNMPSKMALIAAMAVLICASPARADSVDGNPTHPADRHVPSSVRGSLSILFEDVGAAGPLDSCTSEVGQARTDSCSARGRF